MKKLLFVFMICLLFGMFVVADDTVPATSESEAVVSDVAPEPSGGSLSIFGIGGIAAFVIPIIIGILKKTLKLPKSFCPVVAFLIGTIIGVIAFYLKLVPDLDLLEAAVAGAVVGGSSTNLYNIKKYTARFLKNS